MSKLYKYQEDFDEISKVCNCPDTEYFKFEEKEAYRFVFEDINHPHNFIPPAKIKPARYLAKSDREKCEGLGLSLYGKKKEHEENLKSFLFRLKILKK